MSDLPAIHLKVPHPDTPYDGTSYWAGVELGSTLEKMTSGQPTFEVVLLHAANAANLDLAAMALKYATTTVEREDGNVCMTFTKETQP
jgi:hypothetical protein